MPFELFVAWRYLKSKKRHKFISLITYITIAGVAVGVMALITVISVLDGFDRELRNKILGNQSHVEVTAPGGMTDYTAVAEIVKSTPGVVAVAPYVEGMSLIQSDAADAEASILGIDPAVEDNVTDFRKFLRYGNPPDKGGIVLGEELALRLGVSPGSEVTVFVPRTFSLLFMDKVANKTFTVTGLYHSGMYEYDSGQAFMSLETAQRLFNTKETVTGIRVKTNDPSRAHKVAGAVKEKLGSGYNTSDWFQNNQSFLQALAQEKVIMFVIQVLVVIVAAFNIVSTLVMVVLEKTKDIGILKSIGMARRRIMAIFVYQGLLTACVGAGLGLVLGVALTLTINPVADSIGKVTGFDLFSPEIYYFDEIPTQIDPVEIGTIVGAAVLVSLAATLYPAWQAARMDPVEALRYE